ncbi:uncharacterized protein B0T15DRAFT_59572 [Chaetomium strumarium]|uniref:Secreted protein n=1 Tax=Chaetomium strumarium TaxID=1170767 RepID=A0AAJ0H396_9PEZI|nr:hypothetical protein B0T15DRAFT_59572 [Chaetomium strumarium]
MWSSFSTFFLFLFVFLRGTLSCGHQLSSFLIWLIVIQAVRLGWTVRLRYLLSIGLHELVRHLPLMSTDRSYCQSIVDICVAFSIQTGTC